MQKWLPVKVLQESEEGEDEGEWFEEVSSCVIYLIHCKNLCKCHNVTPPITTIKEKN
jgi:hypothetical protein